MTEALTATQPAEPEAFHHPRLAELEQVIERGRHQFEEVAAALFEIRESRLYKMTHRTWESYCKERWGFGKSHANRLIQAAAVTKSLDATMAARATTVRHVRELTRVDPEQWDEVLEEASQIAGGGEPTVEVLKQVVDKRVPPPVPRDKSGKKKPPRLQTRRTPRWLFEYLDNRFGPFVLDAFADADNAMCHNFYTQEQNGCAQPWLDVTFWNPEFNDIWTPMAWAVRQGIEGMRSIGICPMGGSQDWYHELAIQGTIYVPDCRINFDTHDGLPTGAKCHNGLKRKDCMDACGCVNGADRDTIIVAFGQEHFNESWKKGDFRVKQMKVKDLRPKH